ncbi:hypothetical protein NDU88_002154 [Pleurodeles waltl]|uniref:Uncharacterized protein n=1 Tax=Pleurodeles waltl TaxID=8319 RepID=A0AAV7NGU3_PLEWA|nr:hypothetical protein NDU88_002154 [Pleurodeles waltl]
MPSGAAPGVLVLAVPGCLEVYRKGASPLVASTLVDASSLFGVRSRGGRGRKAASVLRLRHLAPSFP